jgi:2-keto-3-deoxy-L-rhamnonate aldolase RhmA
VLLAVVASSALAQVPPDWDPADWEFGQQWAVDGEVPIWNPVMQKVKAGEPIIGGTIRGTDPRTYCAMAEAGYDFMWVEMQHEAISWEQVARMWRTCPGPAVPGVRVAHESEGNLQIPVDMGALVVVVPTVDTVEEAERVVEWTYYPPMGRRSHGGGQGPGELWGDVPGGFRATWNENVVLVVMIETLEGVKNAREIANVPGVDGLFAASGDLGNFSGYGDGDPEYEMLITEVVEAAQEAGKFLCGPLRWMGTRPEYTCFQASTEGANIRRGAQAEIQAGLQRFDEARSGVTADEESGAAEVLAELGALCGSIVYEADCYDAVRRAATAARSLPEGQQEEIVASLIEIAEENPNHAERIRAISEEAGLPLADRDR